MDVKKEVSKALGGKGKRYTPQEIHIQRTQNRGYMVKHRIGDKHGNPPTDGQRAELTYGVPNHVELLKHLTDHFGPDEEEQPNDPDEATEETENYPEASPGARPILQKGA